MIKEKVVATIMMMIYVFSLSPLSMYAQESRDIVREKEELLGSIREGIVEPISNSKEIKALEGGEVAVEGARIIIPVGALETDTEIKITKLQKTPEIGESIINVTNGGGGYRFEPAGTQFLRAVEIELGYDKKLNEKEGSLEDLKTYYYDVVEKQWVALETKGYDKERGVVKSISTHFTDMINGTLSLPESAGPIDVNLNSIKNLEAAHASVGVVKLEGLEGSSQGDASFNLKIELPDGRRGMKPQVTVSYSSGGGNGLVGKGFDINYGSSISVDTRKGSVNYKNTKDFVYIYDGVLLEKVKNSETAYRRLRESQHSEIKYEKNGNYWVVREKDGSKKYYGKSGNSWSGIDENKKHVWHLEKVQDIYGNTIEYSYLKEDGYVYPDRIYYTGYEGGGERNQGQYVIRFGYEERKDIRVDMRGGYKSELKNRLRTVEIAEEGGVIQRSYVFEYEEGIAKESKVKNFICYGDYGKGERGEEWWRYGFEYEKIQEKEGKPQYFSDPISYGNVPLWVTNNENGGTQYSIGGGVGIGFGIPVVADVRVSGGANWSNEQGATYSQYQLIDMNGDGLLDVVRQMGSKFGIRLNRGKGFEESERYVEIEGLADIDIEKEESKSNTVGGYIYLGAGTPVPFISAGGGPVWSSKKGKSSLSSSFMDIDGDGLVDIVLSGKAYYYKNISEGEYIGFKREQIRVEGIVNDYEEKLKEGEEEGYHKTYYIQRPFRMWKSLYEGEVSVKQTIERVEKKGAIESGLYSKAGKVEGASIRLLSLQERGESSVQVRVGKNERLYYIHDVKGLEGGEKDIRENDIEWNIKISYTKVKPYKSTREILIYSPFKQVSTCGGLENIYEEVGEEGTLYRLKNGWQNILSRESEEEQKLKYKILYDRGYYIPQAIKKERFEEILRRKSKSSIETLGIYYIYNSGQKEYQAIAINDTNEKERELVDSVRDIFDSSEKDIIVKDFAVEGIVPQPRLDKIEYQVYASGNKSNQRLKKEEGSIYEKGSYIVLGNYGGEEIYVRNKELYIGGVKQEVSVELQEGTPYKIIVDKEKQGEAQIIWEFSEKEEKARGITAEEREKIYEDSKTNKKFDVLFGNVHTYGRGIFNINDSYWSIREKNEAPNFFSRYISKGVISQAEVDYYFNYCFDLVAVKDKRKTQEAQYRDITNEKGEVIGREKIKEEVWEEYIKYWNYVRRGENDRKAYGNTILQRLDKVCFFSDVFACYNSYDGLSGQYKLGSGYEGAHQLDELIKWVTSEYKLLKYQNVKKTIVYNSSYAYAVENNRYKYLGIGRDGLSLEKKESTIKLWWDSKSDYSVGNDAGEKIFDKSGNITVVNQEDLEKAIKEERGLDVTTIVSDDILYGGMNNWYYGIWIGDEGINAFSEKTLYKQYENVESYSTEYKGLSKEEAKKKEEENKKKNETEVGNLRDKEEEDLESYIEANKETTQQKYYMPQNYETVKTAYGKDVPKEESENKGALVTDSYLLGAISVISETQSKWVGEERIKNIKSDYYFPYVKGDYIHINRTGGSLYYSLPGIEKNTEGKGGGGLGVLRSSKTEGKDVGVSINLAHVSGSYTKSKSDGKMVENIQDINGDGIPDIVKAGSGKFSVQYGKRNLDGSVYFSEVQDVIGGGSVLSQNYSEIKTTGFGSSVGTQLLVERNSEGDVVGMSLPASASLSASFPKASGINKQQIGMLDINGDGLADYIESGSVKLGTGYNYIGYPITRMPNLISEGKLNSESKSFGVGVGTGGGSKSDNTLMISMGISAGINSGSSTNNNTQMLLDINGDGLPDIVKKNGVQGLSVQFNTGTGFLDAQDVYIPDWSKYLSELKSNYWENTDGTFSYDTLRKTPVIGLLYKAENIEGNKELENLVNELDFTSTKTAGINGGMNAGGTVSIPIPFIFLTVSISVNGNTGAQVSSGLTQVSVKMFDIDGDGYVDQVLRIPGYGTFAKLNLGAKVGLLKKINLPQGGRYELEYERVGNTVNMPQSKYVLSKVRSIDSLETESVGVDTYRTNYEYKDGYYDRIQKEFYGFSNVISKSVDEYNTVLSHQETAYQNRAYYTKGMEKTQRIYSISSGRLLYEKETIVDIAPYARVAAVFTTIHDEHLLGLSRKSIQRFEYENTYGNVLAYHDDGDEKNSSQRISAFIEYWNDNNNYLHNHPLKIEVRNGQGNVLRIREAVYSEKGSLQELKQYSSNTKYLSHRYEYDGYGNVTKVTDALGVKILYEYDRSHHQYLVKIGQQGRNGTLYESYIEWDEKRGLKQGEKDVNDNELSYTYDAKGRLTAIRTSYDRGRVSSVSYQYVLEKGNRWYAVSANKILYDADDESVMLTVVELDGLGRVRRTGKSGTVYSVESKKDDKGWNVSGTVSYDGKGRVVKEGQPYFVKSQEGEDGVGDFIKSNRQSLNATHKYTEKSYDSLDRVIQVVLPDASVMKTVYGLEELENESSYRIMYEYVQSIDPLDNQSIQYKDVRNNIIQVERRDGSNKLLTKAQYYYNELGEMQKAEDAKGNPVIVSYDMLGRKLSLESRDGGREEYTYDDKGLLWKVTDSELRRRQQYILYEYDEFGRIEKIDYPSSKDIVYEYGRIEDKEKKQVGKIKRIEDESGIIEYEYGRLGELVKEKRSLYQKTDSLGRKREAQMVYRSDYLGRMQSIEYPDGEVVRYEYNYGGEVEKVYGEKQGETFIYVEKIGYDEFGQRVFIRLGNGVETTYTYDENRRWLSHIETISSIQYSNPVLQNMSYEFDLVGNVKGYSNNAGSYTTSQQYEYDGLYQLVGVKGQTENREVGLVDYKARYEQRYEFDESGLGNMIKKTSESHQSTTRQLGDNLNYSLDYEYEKDFAHRARKIGNRYYKYDSNGNVLVEQESEFSKEEGSVPYNVEVLENDVHVADYGWGIKEEKVGSGSEKYVYKRSYEWNERKLLKSSNDNRYKVEYVYGSDGQRSGKRSISSGGSDSESLYFNKMWVWRYDGLLSDRSGRNSKHIYVGESRIVTKISRADGSFTSEEKVKQYYYHTDHLGSAQLISDPYGKEYERVEYTPYGELWVEKASAASNIDIPYRFTGKERDKETGLYYYGARYLDSKTSRWLSTDPALGEYIPGAPINDEARKRNGNLPGLGGVFNTVNLHLYHYAGNNPVKYIDPDGRDIVIFGKETGTAISFLSQKSPVFDKHLKNLLRSTNSLGVKLVVFFTTEPDKYAGNTITNTDISDKDVPYTLTLDKDGNIIAGSIKKGEKVQMIQINIDMERIKEGNINILEVVAEEVMHASDASDVGSEAWNKQRKYEQENYSYFEQPTEKSAKERVEQVHKEVIE